MVEITLQFWGYIYMMINAAVGAYVIGGWLGDISYYIYNKFAKRGKQE